jgi:hypothetical protein
LQGSLPQENCLTQLLHCYILSFPDIPFPGLKYDDKAFPIFQNIIPSSMDILLPLLEAFV